MTERHEHRRSGLGIFKMAASMTKIFGRCSALKNGFYLRTAARLMSGDVVAPPSEHTSAMQVTIMNKEQDGGIMIDAYSPIGFKLNTGIRVVGPCAIFPRSILHWNVAEAADITVESLTLFTMLEPKLDVLIIGKGEAEGKVSDEVTHFLRKHKINHEILPTDHACATFNFLNAERRVVAAALIPPSYVEQYSDDIMDVETRPDMFNLSSDLHQVGEAIVDKHLPPGITQDEIMSEGPKLASDIWRKNRKPKLPEQGD